MFRHFLTHWAEEYFYRPLAYQRFISYLLSPFALIWCFCAQLRRALKRPVDYGVPVISVGNLNIGGSGKTPVSIAIAKNFAKPAIILRGYKRTSKGLVVVSRYGEILCDVKTSGDEAMLYAQELKNALVIVSEERTKAIQKAKELGAEVVILDDGFGKINIKKFDILIRPNPSPANTFCIPSGAYRESIGNYKNADLVLEEGVNFERIVHVENAAAKMILLTAIANPARLERYLPKSVIGQKTFADHYSFNKDELAEILRKSGADSILTTTKDAVKMEGFDLPLSILKLQIKLSSEVMGQINSYLARL
ncbi:MAG: tetraacyldisaccharide 4'-kinase [Campylobacteraceae bacterium]|nr:tetraacyldisaccharide 4'-kinase [Campylobacteraceae bacterium]